MTHGNFLRSVIKKKRERKKIDPPYRCTIIKNQSYLQNSSDRCLVDDDETLLQTITFFCQSSRIWSEKKIGAHNIRTIIIYRRKISRRHTSPEVAFSSCQCVRNYMIYIYSIIYLANRLRVRFSIGF